MDFLPEFLTEVKKKWWQSRMHFPGEKLFLPARDCLGRIVKSTNRYQTMAVFRRETSSNANKRQNYSDVVFQKWTCDAFKTIFLVKCQKASQALLTLFQKNDTAKNGQLPLKINPAQRILCFGSLFRWDEKIIKDHQQTMIIFGCLTSRNGPKRELGRLQLFLRNVFGSKRPSDQKKHSRSFDRLFG